jgi:sugar phosphate isomerase/epimerase
MKRAEENRTARVELLCGLVENENDPEEIARWEETQAERKRADAIADTLGVRAILDMPSVQHGVYHNDAYLYPTVDKLEPLLDALQQAGVEYHEVDLPDDMPDDAADALRERLKAKHPFVEINPTTGVDSVAKAKRRLLAF